ncbi:small phosphatase [Gracilaria domingensis]|nr:small phosphatase [Gracilaria domingensis]
MNHIINFEAIAGRLQSSNRSPLHIVLDVHGVLVHRAQASHSRSKAARDHRNPWRVFPKRQAVWLRPYLRTFLLEIFRRHNVAIWSSAQEKNITPMLEAMSTEFRMSPSLLHRLCFAWHRPQCRPDRQTGKYASIKNLADLWEDREHGARFTPRNTILVDDSPTKTRLFPPSAINVREYSPESLGRHFNNDDTLLWLILYLEYIADRVERIGNVVDARVGGLPFEEFCVLGRSYAMSRRRRRERGKSLAWVFLGEIRSNSRTDPDDPIVIVETESGDFVEERSGERVNP